MTPGKPQRVGILFSGGDAPGMNPLLRAFVRLGLQRHRTSVVGIRDGYQGLVRTVLAMRERRLDKDSLLRAMQDSQMSLRLVRNWPDLLALDYHAVSGIVTRGGIVLGCGRSREFYDHAMRRQIGGLLGLLDIGTLVVCGGNGSLAGAALLSQEAAVRTIGIPATIDNDVAGSDLAIGFDTAANTIVRAVRCFADTADSHHRVMVLETMGRACGDLARTAALASGAEAVITPEHGPLSADRMLRIAQRIAAAMQHGRRHAIVLLCEGVTTANGKPASSILASYLASSFAACDEPLRSIETRCSVLGHLQRGGPPSVADSVLAAQFAEAAWREIAGHQNSGALGVRWGETALAPYDTPPPLDRHLRREQEYQLQKDITQPPHLLPPDLGSGV